MKVVSAGGIVNDGADYLMWLERPFSQPALKLEFEERTGGDPLVTAARRQAKGLALHVSVGVNAWGNVYEEADRAPLREALLAALDTEDAAVALVAADDDGSDERYVYVVAQKPDEQPDARGQGSHFVFTLATHGDTRWRANTATSETWEVAASAETLAVVNGGSLAARPVYTIQPTDAKSAPGNAFIYKQFQAVKWPGRSNVSHYPVDVTAADWDTDALLTATKLYAAYGQNNIGLMVDGRMMRRWVENYDTTFTSVWANLDWAPAATGSLAAAMGSGDTVESITSSTDTSGFPLSGILQIDDEIFTYTDKDDITKTFLGVTRAAKGSSAAAHTTGDTIYWIQHDIWLLYGGSGYWLNTYDDFDIDEYGWQGEDIYKPVFDLAFSSNDSWRFTSFGESGAENVNRSMSWRPGGPTYGTFTTGDPYDEIGLARPDSIEGASGFSFWSLAAAYRMSSLRLIGRGANYEPGTRWDVALYQQGVAYLTIPEPVVGNEESALVDFNVTVTGTSAGWEQTRLEQRCAGAMELRLDTAYITWEEYPTVTAGVEIAVYDLALTLENVTTGQSITLTLPMTLNDQLEVDTANHTVRLLSDGSSQYHALAKDTRRKEMLPLAPGSNTLRVTEDGLAGVTVYVEFEERTYT